MVHVTGDYNCAPSQSGRTPWACCRLIHFILRPHAEHWRRTGCSEIALVISRKAKFGHLATAVTLTLIPRSMRHIGARMVPLASSGHQIWRTVPSSESCRLIGLVAPVQLTAPAQFEKVAQLRCIGRPIWKGDMWQEHLRACTSCSCVVRAGPSAARRPVENNNMTARSHADRLVIRTSPRPGNRPRAGTGWCSA
jgi:hypothetical protein